MSEMILDKIDGLFKTYFSKPTVTKDQLESGQALIKLGAIKTADGSVTIEFDGDILEVGKPAWIMAEDDTKVPVPIGEHPLEDGTILVVTEEGIVGEIKSPQNEEEAPATEDLGKENVTEKANQDTQIAKEIESAIKSILIKYSEMESKVNEVIKQNEDLKIALSEQPSTKKINVVPTQTNSMSLVERINNKLNN